jgi:2-dehydro-3-deoxy-D-gluconate 5-dehydrogenase
MDLKLEGRVAIVTGASRGLGRAAARALLAEGAKVLAVARSAQDLRALEDEASGGVRAVPCDVRDLDRVAELPKRALAAFGRLDIIINNAGIAPAGAFVEQTSELWQEVFTVNVFAPVALARAAAGHLIAQRSGKIVNIASTAGIRGKPTLVAYSASKGAVLQFTAALAGEWARHGVQVNAIAPGAFDTEAQAAVLATSSILERRLRKIPAGRMADPPEIGPTVCLLSSAASDFITGSVFVIDGGEAAKL